jgi:Colicin V production protein
MIIWAIALLLAASLAFAGFCFGVIRALTTFFGLFLSVLVARIFAHSVTPALAHLGIKDPVLAWLLAPLLVFLLALTVVKVLGFVAQRNVNLYFKYKAGDLKLALWTRLNARLGIFVGLANAVVYMVLISMVIYFLSYATTQLSSEDNAGWSVKLLNEAGRELQSTGMARVAAAVDPMPANYYKAVDLAGLIYHNDLLEARLSRYPAFLSMAERPEFQDIANDKDFAELRQRQPPISEILDHPKLKPILNNPDELREIWAILVNNFDDILGFLKTGQSQKYADQKLVGNWDFNLNATLTTFQESKPDATSQEMRRARRGLTLMFGKTTILATLDNQAFLKNLGAIKISPEAPGAPRGRRGGRGGGPPGEMAPDAPVSVVAQPTVLGAWSEDGADYKFSFSTGNYQATVDGDTLTVTGFNLPLTFDREY